MSENIIDLLTTAAEEFVINERRKGRVPSHYDIGDHLDSKLYWIEKKIGEQLTSEQFEELCEEIEERYIKQGKAYRYSDWNSFYLTVRNNNLISTKEYNMQKNLRIAKKQGHKIIFRDTEFPVDCNGLYIISK